jgi:rhamnosyltransferase
MTNRPDISIVFRALNEEKYFEKALKSCQNQIINEMTYEILLVDSGSTDRTLEIARKFDCKVINIPKSKFSFGRSLNWGCRNAQGRYLVFISAHCIPKDPYWLSKLIDPLKKGLASYSYGKQIGSETSKFSEKQLFAKYFPNENKLQNTDFFVNNANSAIKKSTWEKYKFDEEVTGLEDMVLGKKLISDSKKIAYVADAVVIHIHEEDLKQIKNRYYREALTLRTVLPEIQMNIQDFIRFTFIGILNDFIKAYQQKELFKNIIEIISFRVMQFGGSYKGQNENKKITRSQKEAYYYPAIKNNLVDDKLAYKTKIN